MIDASKFKPHEDARVGRRIGHVLMNANWRTLWPAMICELYLAGSSNHVVLELKLHPIDKPSNLLGFTTLGLIWN